MIRKQRRYPMLMYHNDYTQLIFFSVYLQLYQKRSTYI